MQHMRSLGDGLRSACQTDLLVVRPRSRCSPAVSKQIHAISATITFDRAAFAARTLINVGSSCRPHFSGFR